MSREYVWAINENGKPEKCYAKEENRGKKNCNHRFHAKSGEDQISFLNRYLVDENDSFEDRSYWEDITSQDLPDYSESIKELCPVINRKYNSWSEVVEKTIHSPYLNNTNIPFLEGVDVAVSESEDPNDDKATLITLEFTEEDGSKYYSSFSIPNQDESGEIDINGTKYRCIPVISKYKKGVSVSEEGNLKLKNEYGFNSIIINKDSDNGYFTYYDENLKKKHCEAPVEEIEKYLSDKDCSLTDKQKEIIDSLDPVVKERFGDIGMDGLRSLGPDKPNDLSYREISTYEDFVAFSISKKLKSVDSIYRKKMKRGEDQNYNIESTTDIIKKDLIGLSNIQLSDNINPIAAMSQSQKLSYCGAGSHSANSMPKSAKLTDESYFGLVDVNDVSLGSKIGSTVALKGYIDKNGVAKPDKSCVSGSDFIPYMKHSDPNRAAMAISQMREAVPIVGGEDPKLSTSGWDKIKGSKLGANLTVAYIPEASVWEDAIVMSESAAKRYTTVQSKKYIVDTNKGASHLKVGDELKSGDNIGGTKIRYDGKITSISGDGTKIEVETVYPMKVGDKLAGRHGNKGVVSKIVPDAEMPKVNGVNADLIMSPISVAGRSNLGQIYEVNGGEINKTSEAVYKGKKIEVTAGPQFIMRLNEIADKKLLSNAAERGQDKNFKSRFGEMESILLTSNEQRLEVLNYIKHQEKNYGEEKLVHTLKGIGVDAKPSN